MAWLWIAKRQDCHSMRLRRRLLPGWGRPHVRPRRPQPVRLRSRRGGRLAELAQRLVSLVCRNLQWPEYYHYLIMVACLWISSYKLTCLFSLSGSEILLCWWEWTLKWCDHSERRKRTRNYKLPKRRPYFLSAKGRRNRSVSSFALNPSHSFINSSIAMYHDWPWGRAHCAMCLDSTEVDT